MDDFQVDKDEDFGEFTERVQTLRNHLFEEYRAREIDSYNGHEAAESLNKVVDGKLIEILDAAVSSNKNIIQSDLNAINATLCYYRMSRQDALPEWTKVERDAAWGSFLESTMYWEHRCYLAGRSLGGTFHMTSYLPDGDFTPDMVCCRDLGGPSIAAGTLFGLPDDPGELKSVVEQINSMLDSLADEELFLSRMEEDFEEEDYLLVKTAAATLEKNPKEPDELHNLRVRVLERYLKHTINENCPSRLCRDILSLPNRPTWFAFTYESRDPNNQTAFFHGMQVRQASEVISSLQPTTLFAPPLPSQHQAGNHLSKNPTWSEYQARLEQEAMVLFTNCQEFGQEGGDVVLGPPLPSDLDD